MKGRRRPPPPSPRPPAPSSSPASPPPPPSPLPATGPRLGALSAGRGSVCELERPEPGAPALSASLLPARASRPRPLLRRAETPRVAISGRGCCFPCFSCGRLCEPRRGEPTRARGAASASRSSGPAPCGSGCVPLDLDRGGGPGALGGDESRPWGRLRLPGNGAAPPPLCRGSAALPAAPSLCRLSCPARRP